MPVDLIDFLAAPGYESERVYSLAANDYLRRMGTRAVDISGQKFGRLTVIGRDGSGSRGDALWRCRCDCGGTKTVRATNLKSGGTRSCGCLARDSSAIKCAALGRARKVDLSGARFGLWTALRPARGDGWRAGWWCRCDCGTEARVNTNNLRSGRSHSCGCAAGELRRAKLTKHGRADTPEWQAWKTMRQRCHSPESASYVKYGARGIRVCDRWRDSFEAFFADMGPRPSSKHSIDRIDNARGYEPGNCRWATAREQAGNTRRNVYVEAFGERLCAAEWSRRLGGAESLVLGRLKRGWPAERAVSEPLRPWRRSCAG